LAALLIAASVVDARAERRVALVVGNAAYQNTPRLGNPVNDAEDLAAALRRVGFEVMLERNLNKRGMESAIARFARAAQDAEAALFFYAGHGMQHRGNNYLMPVDAKLEDEFNLNFELTRLDDVLFGLERARGVKVLILDACRNNPLLERLTRTATTRDLSPTRGLAKIEATRGMIVAYSTQTNQVAVDGTGRNSPFASALLKEIDEPGLEIGALFRRVAVEVNRMTAGKQLPELSVSLLGEFYLNLRETDLQAWSKVRASADPAELRKFIRDYPKSVLVPDARQRLDAVERERVERERTEKERLAREAAERAETERLTREQAAREKAEREQAAKAEAERQRLAREEAERETARREAEAKVEEERRRVAREQETQDKTTSDAGGRTQVASLPPDTAASSPGETRTTAAQMTSVASILRCSAYSAKPNEWPAFSAGLTFRISGGILKGELLTTKRPGRTIFEGMATQAGVIQIRGRGRYDDGHSVWTTNLSGKISERTTLHGRLQLITGTKGYRDCSLTFQASGVDLRKRLGLSEDGQAAKSAAGAPASIADRPNNQAKP
jgi:uncharacterized caspase-like protein